MLHPLRAGVKRVLISLVVFTLLTSKLLGVSAWSTRLADEPAGNQQRNDSTQDRCSRPSLCVSNAAGNILGDPKSSLQCCFVRHPGIVPP